MRRIMTIVVIVALIFGLNGCQKKDVEINTLEVTETDDTEESETENTEISIDMEKIFVYVCGAVNKEGVYELTAGSRVYEAVELAGGFREDADVRSINQAEVLEDEERIYVPVIGEELQIGSDSDKDGKININKATKEELMTLPGVGESRAESIIQYRNDVGSFQSIEDIMQVSGIKEGLFEKIKDLIKV